MKINIQIILLALFMSVISTNAGLQITEENDVFYHTDRYYTQGASIKWYEKSNYSYGIRNIMYTPQDIAIPEPQPEDRPWAGVTALTIGKINYVPDGMVSWETQLGVVGAWSQSEQIQSWVHKQIGSRHPEGWSNQVPNEVEVNLNIQRSWCLGEYKFKQVRVFSFELGGVANVGTLVDDIGSFSAVHIGYNTPKAHGVQTIMPTSIQQLPFDISVDCFASIVAKYVAHNTMLDGSFFQDGPKQDLEPLVYDKQIGVKLITTLWGFDTTLGYIMTERSVEFKKQEYPQRYGTVIIAFGYSF
jgi:hypothetical protein